METAAGQKERGRGRLGDKNRTVLSEESFISPWIKWLMFSFNMFFWLVSWVLIAIGVWAFLETEKYQGKITVNSILDLIFNFALIFIIFGIFVFLLAFLGAVGALRENTIMLKMFAISLGVLFLLEIGLAIAVFAFSDKVKTELTNLLEKEAIVDYRDDVNLQNIIDWFQETFSCCGVGDQGYKDWGRNVYFNCSSPEFEACSVPYSCCTSASKYSFDSQVINTRCGAGTLKMAKSEASETIYTLGCVNAALQAAQDNLFIIGGIAIGVVVPQLVGIFLAKVLAGQIDDQKKRWSA